MKIVTISGSMRFAKQMKDIARKLEAEHRICALQPVYNKKKNETVENIENIVSCHYQKIDLSDALYVVNIDGYIGEATHDEIEYAKKNNKEIIYHEPIKSKKRK